MSGQQRGGGQNFAMDSLTAEVPLTRGHVAIVDASDAERVKAGGPWHTLTHPGSPHLQYGMRRMWLGGGRSKYVALAQFILDTDLKVDHANGDSLDNRRSNLRIATASQNIANQAVRKNNKSGFKGVCWDSRRQRWMAQIMVDRKTRFLGYFDDAMAGARAYDSAAVAAWGDFACVNFPTGTQRAARPQMTTEVAS